MTLDVVLEHPDTPAEPPGYLRDALDACAEMWASLLESEIERHGVKRVVAGLSGRLQLIAMGFTTFALEYELATKGAGEVRKLWERESKALRKLSKVT